MNEPVDPYLWLEGVEDEAALRWVREQNAVAQEELEHVPQFGAIRDRLGAIFDSDERIPYVAKHGDWYYNFWKDAAHPRGLWRRTTLESYKTPSPAWETVLDLDELAAREGENWVWNAYSVSRDTNRRALLNLSRGGADAAVVREFDLETKSFVPDGFNVPEAKTWVYWRDEDSVFIGTDFGPGSLTTSGYPRVVKRWDRGHKLEEAATVFEGEETDVWCYGYAHQDKEFQRDVIVRGLSFFANETFVRSGDRLSKLQKPDDAEFWMFRDFALLRLKTDWAVGGRTYAQGALLAIKLEDFLSGSRDFEVLFEPTERTSLQGYSENRRFIVLNTLENVRGAAHALEYAGGAWVRHAIPMPEFGQVNACMVADDDSSDYFVQVTDYLTPSSLLYGQIGQGVPEPIKRLPAMFDASGLETRQFEAASKDGTRVPYFVVSRRNLEPNGQNPTLLYGYGGFEVSQLPAYKAGVGAGWLAQGGVYAVANIRGGGEFGPAWHRAALRENRQRAYDDFIAVAEDLIVRGITSPPKLGIQGGSNGGLLMGVMLTERPDLFGAVVCQVPLLDMKRYHLLLAGASWIEEYGNPDAPQDWAFMSKYSPYQNVRSGVKYPRALLTTSTRDDRVHPGHARKMFARLKELGHDALYFENIEGGHGGAADNAQLAYMNALAYAFLLETLF